MASTLGPDAEDAAQPLARLEEIQGSAAGSTIQLAADFLAYARDRYTPIEFKHQLVERLLPTVPRRGAPHPVERGQQFGKFKIVEKLGKGGMAVVFRAVDPERTTRGGRGKVEQEVALKVMRDDLAMEPEYVRRFLREAANAALVDHPNVVRVFEVGSVSGRLYFTMELIEGETLKETLARGPLDEDHGLQVLCQLVDGLVAAHDRGIGHRDLKPSNIMLMTSRTRYGVELRDEFDVRVKVTDFGLAHMLDADTSDVIGDGKFLGTAKYVAPEVIKGGETTLKSDLFSLGVLAFQMFSGRAPFAARTKLEFITANLQAQAPLLDTLVPVSRDLALLVAAMLDKEPTRRPDAASLRRDLGRLATRGTKRERVVVKDDPSSAFHVGAPAGAPRRVPPLPVPVLVGVGAAGLLALVVAFVAFSGGDDRPPDRPTGTATQVASTEPPPPPPRTEPRPPASPSRVRGHESLPWVPLPATFADALARGEFERAVRSGDEAWVGGRRGEALTFWETAERLGRAENEALRARVRDAKRELALARADEAERRGNAAQAVLELEQAVSFGAGGHEVEARLAHARDVRELQQKLGEARALRAGEPAAAARLLEELLPTARRLGREYEVEVQTALARVQGGGGPTDGTEAAPATPGSSRGDELLAQAEGLLRDELFDAAEQAIHTARKAGASSARADALVRRLARARLTPEGFLYVEVPPAGHADAEVHGFYGRPQRVTNREFHAWFRHESARSGLMPPRAWQGSGSPPAGAEDAPVEGVDPAQARAFAAARGDRLPTEAELPALQARVGAPAAQGAVTGGRLDAGFFTVRDVGGR